MATMEKELRERARDVLKNRVHPREDVTAVKQNLARDLAQSLGAEQLSSPLSLVDLDTTVTPTEALQGNYREYIEAVQKNINIRSEFAQLQEEHDAATALLSSPAEEDQQARLLELQLEINSLEQEHERLTIADKYLEELDQQPAAAPDFLDSDLMYKECTPLPELPKELMDGFTQDREGPNREIQELLSRLQKAMLRNKLLAQREKQNFEKLKTKTPIEPGSLSPEIQLHALNAVKDSLINWIEGMLSKAGGDEDEPSILESPSKPRQGESEKFDRDAHMAEIQKEYQTHIDLRKEILISMAQLKQLKFESPKKQDQQPEHEPEMAPPSSAKPEAFLLMPYLEKLQAISREQKGLIQEKSHINTALTRQQQDLNKLLNHLVDESYLLQTFPANTPNKQLSFGEATKGVNKSNVTSQVEPWISAANSAQIAMLEAVFEKVEEGQVAAEDAMEALDQVRKLLNKEEAEPEEPHGDQDNAEPDMWVEDDENGRTRVRKNREKKVEKQKGESIYAKLDGNLGLINE
ncbi:uncharacterized protein GGS22DRAFT_194262 [Annulohypoxylon maeteangense]|uniref:uncharacterized protein n=1 Tax=Annulohypoxylon maeteangense TaxID=1927788 RepID=UPI00200734BA|nr:uncharacterized protein GGS22DRAFT_194262 [Annulohypoxylon maeteangense]KAI0889986.1 hypothetical protein GGS22DRAFT_194262 [Annulohypoxylon maeteangense]